MPAYIYLGLAILMEVVATSALKASDQLTRIGPTIVVVIGYVLAFYLLAHALRNIPLGVAYAIWSGVGMALLTIIGLVVYRETPDVAAIVGIGFIIAGVAIIQLFSKMVH